MIVNDIKEITEEEVTQYSEPADVRFIRYDGYDKYCSLCFGVLELQINGEKWLFSDASKEKDICPAFYPHCMFCKWICGRKTYYMGNGYKCFTRRTSLLW